MSMSTVHCATAESGWYWALSSVDVIVHVVAIRSDAASVFVSVLLLPAALLRCDRPPSIVAVWSGEGS